MRKSAVERAESSLRLVEEAAAPTEGEGVVRYDASLNPSADGEWVRFEDYRRLVAENARLRAGGCRFNCRNNREIFSAGYAMGRVEANGADNPHAAYRRWRRETRDNPVATSSLKGIPVRVNTGG